jgi:hypothetical protein
MNKVWVGICRFGIGDLFPLLKMDSGFSRSLSRSDKCQKYIMAEKDMTALMKK